MFEWSRAPTVETPSTTPWQERVNKLAVPPLIPLDLTATSIVQLLSWDKTGTPTNVPGLCPGSYINIAVESLAYLELTAGVHRFHIRSDDRAGLYSGTTPGGHQRTGIVENPGNTADSTLTSSSKPMACIRFIRCGRKRVAARTFTSAP